MTSRTLTASSVKGERGDLLPQASRLWLLTWLPCDRAGALARSF